MRTGVRDRIETVMRQWVKAFSAHDVEGLAQLYTEDAMFFGALGRLRRGREAILDYLSQHWAMAEIGISILEVDLLSRDVALAAVRGTASSAGAEPRDFRFLQTYVWTADGWRIAGHHGSYEDS